MNISVNQEGFVTQWLIGGPRETGFLPPADLPRTWTDQLGYEKAMRGAFYHEAEKDPPAAVRLGQPSPCGEAWRYYSGNHGWFVDASSFYNVPTAVRLNAAAVLRSDRRQTKSAVLWTYAAVDLWVNGVRVLGAHTPVYKPIRQYRTELPLEKGKNAVFVSLQNLGIRDTRSLFGLQLLNTDGVTTDLPDAAHAEPFVFLDEWLSSLVCKNGTLRIPTAPPSAAFLELPGHEPAEITEAGLRRIPEEIGRFTVAGMVSGQKLERPFELIEHLHAHPADKETGDHRIRFLERLAAEKWEPRDGDYFSVFHVLARRALNTPRPDDDELLARDLDYIERRGDCADFLVIGWIRLLKNYEVSDRLKRRAKEVLLSFRYWMDEKGSDGMCYWSENHALMFYGAQLVVGNLFPDDTFTLSGRTGREQSAVGAARCRAWLDDMEKNGAEEFNSATYLPVTLTALLNLVDFAPKDLSGRASAIVDSLLRQLCLHVFHGSSISPQGRVYRDVIYPYQQSIQSVLHMISSKFPYSDAENIWDVSLFTSCYRFPPDLVKIAEQDAHCSYVSGNARIVVEKTPDFILTSVRCPREKGDEPSWHNLCFDENADRGTNAYVRSLNERFHGTSVFEPGVYGYQQHLWYAAVSSECVVFVNHPGSPADLDEMRPGYWYGNGIFPAVLQRGETLGAVYEIPDIHPISFTHVFWPTVKFDECRQDGHWLFGRCGHGCVGLWCSELPEAADGVLNACEYRCRGRQTAYYCVCGSAESLAAFAARCLEAKPSYHPLNHTLAAEKGYKLTFVPHENKTQYI